MDTTGERIADLRRKKNLDQQVLADALGVSKQQISRYEKGISTMNVDDIKIVARILETSVQFLITGDNKVSIIQEPEVGYMKIKETDYIKLLERALSNSEAEILSLKNAGAVSGGM